MNVLMTCSGGHVQGAAGGLAAPQLVLGADAAPD